MSKLKPYLQLVRLPNLFTAAADSLAGWLLVSASLGDVGQWGLLVLASVATYAGGIVLNDVFDFQVDLRERPKRPLPSGKVGWKFAVAFGVGSLVVGLTAAALSSQRALVVELVLILAVLHYDSWAKKTVLGPEVMGLCRGLNLLLGLSASDSFGGVAGVAVALAYAAFVSGITWISRSEVTPESDGTIGRAAGILLQNAAFLMYLAVSVHPEAFGVRDRSPITLAGGVLLLLAVAVFVNSRTIRALRSVEASVVQNAVRSGILSLVWLHVGLLLSVQGPLSAVAVAWLWVPAVVTGRWVYST